MTTFTVRKSSRRAELVPIPRETADDEIVLSFCDVPEMNFFLSANSAKRIAMTLIETAGLDPVWVAREILIGRQIVLTWGLDDVIDHVKNSLGVDIDARRAWEILERMYSNYSAEVGISWTEVKIAAQEVLGI